MDVRRFVRKHDVGVKICGFGLVVFLGLTAFPEEKDTKTQIPTQTTNSAIVVKLVDNGNGGYTIVEQPKKTKPVEHTRIKSHKIRPLRPAFSKTDSLRGQDVTVHEVLSRKKADSSNFLGKSIQRDFNEPPFKKTNLSLLDETGAIYRIYIDDKGDFYEGTYHDNVTPRVRKFVTTNEDVINFNECFIIKDTENYMDTMGLIVK